MIRFPEFRFSVPALRTGRARRRASGSPQDSINSSSIDAVSADSQVPRATHHRCPAMACRYSTPSLLASASLPSCCLPSPCGRFSRPPTTTETPPHNNPPRTIRLPFTLRCEGTDHCGSHVHQTPFDGGGAQLHSYSIALGTLQFSPRPSNRHRYETVESDPTMGMRKDQHCSNPYPPGLSRSTTKGASTTGSHTLHLPVSLARPRCRIVPSLRYIVRAASRLGAHVCALPALSFSRSLQRPRVGSRALHGVLAPRGAQPNSSMISRSKRL